MLKIKVFNNPSAQEDEINKFLAAYALYGDAPINMFENNITFLYQDVDDSPMSIIDKIKHARSLLKGHLTDLFMQEVQLGESEIELVSSEGSDEAKQAIQKDIEQKKKFIAVTKQKILNLETILSNLTA